MGKTKSMGLDLDRLPMPEILVPLKSAVKAPVKVNSSLHNVLLFDLFKRTVSPERETK